MGTVEFWLCDYHRFFLNDYKKRLEKLCGKVEWSAEEGNEDNQKCFIESGELVKEK